MDTSAYRSKGRCGGPGQLHNHRAGREAAGYTERPGEADRSGDGPGPYDASDGRR